MVNKEVRIGFALEKIFLTRFWVDKMENKQDFFFKKKMLIKLKKDGERLNLHCYTL